MSVGLAAPAFAGRQARRVAKTVTKLYYQQHLKMNNGETRRQHTKAQCRVIAYEFFLNSLLLFSK
jgi:hypothetical protein